MSAWGQGGAAKSCNALLTRVENNDPVLKELVILPSKIFGPVEANRLASAIGSGINTHLTCITASGHALPPSLLSIIGAAIASAASKENRIDDKGGIVRIALGDKAMGDEGVVALCEPLESGSGCRLELVDLGWKGLSKKGMTALGKTFGISPTILSLNLSRNTKVGDDGLASFCAAAIERSRNNSRASEERELGPTVFPVLKQLNLSECNITSCGLKSLSEFLLLGKERVVSSNSHSNSSNANLSLQLNSNPIGNGGMMSIAPLISHSPSSVLISLSMIECDIGDEGIRALTSALENSGPCREGLQFLDLSKNKIGPEGGRLLGESLKRLCLETGSSSWGSLTELHLAGNPLESEGVVGLCNGIYNNGSSVVNLNICETSCGSEGAIAALRLPTLTSLRLFNNKLGSEGFEKITPLLKGGHVNLVNLDLGGNSAETDAVVGLLRVFLEKMDGENTASALRVLEIGGNEIGDGAEVVFKEIEAQMPELDIARDRPKVQQ